ncbi:hypothetical protein KW797_04625 [Candidatus Parcubacteria bacterium]|nr:hypothetical protein [Candidatus Parcubacteria bacterium]
MQKVKDFFTTRNIIITLSALLFLAIVGAVYFYQEAHADPAKAAKEDLDRTVLQVGRLIVLPSDETPTLATVSEPEKLKDQPFFANAQKGDKVLIYSNARKAILYRPSERKIIEVAPVNLGTGVK